MDGWLLPETITAGTIAVMAIMLVYKFLGQRTDPKLLELLKLLTESDSLRDQARDNTFQRLAESFDRNTSGLQAAVDMFAQSIQQILNATAAEHAQQLQAITAIPGGIVPSIDTLAQQLSNQAGRVDTMNNNAVTQAELSQQILDAVLRLERRVGEISAKFDAYKSATKTLGKEIEETKANLASIKGDVAKLQPTTIEKADKTKGKS